MTNEDKKYDELIGTLKNLQKVKAHPNFEADLKRKLNAEKFEKPTKQRSRFWVPSRLVPTFGLAIVAIVIIFLVDLNSGETDNPFLIEPRVRKDMIVVTNEGVTDIPEKKLTEKEEKPEVKLFSDKIDSDQKQKTRSKGKTDRSLVSEPGVTSPESTSINEEEAKTEDEVSTELATGLAIRKSGLNFRQIRQTKLQKEEILELKKKVHIKGKTRDLQ